MANYLFIGGGHDGKVLDVREGVREIRMPVYEAQFITDTISPVAPAIKTESYFLEEMRSQTKSYWMFRHESLTTDDVLTMLL